MNPIMTPNECKVVQSCPEMVVKIVPKYGLIVPNLVSERTIKRGVPCIKTHAISTLRFQFSGADAVRGSAKIVSRLLLDFTVVKIPFQGTVAVTARSATGYTSTYFRVRHRPRAQGP